MITIIYRPEKGVGGTRALAHSILYSTFFQLTLNQFDHFIDGKPSRGLQPACMESTFIAGCVGLALWNVRTLHRVQQLKQRKIQMRKICY